MSSLQADALRQLAQQILASQAAPPAPAPGAMSSMPIDAPMSSMPPQASMPAPMAAPMAAAPAPAPVPAPMPMAPAPAMNVKVAQRGIPESAMAPVAEGINNAFDTAEGRLGQARNVNVAGMSDAARQNEEVRGSELQAAGASANVEAEKQDMLRQVYDQYLAKADEIDRRQTAIQGAAQEQMSRQMQRIEASAAEVQNYQLHNYFADKSNLGRVMALISSACSGGANGLAGQPGAPTPMDRIIEQDMQLQTAQLGQKKAGLDAQTSIFGLLRQQTGDVMSAQLAYRNAMDSKLKIMIDQVGAKLNTPAAKLAEMKAQIDAKTAERNQKASQFYLGNITNTLERDAGLQPQKAALVTDLAKHMESMQISEAAASKDMKTGLTGIPGSEHLSDASKDQLRKQLAQTQSSVATIDELLTKNGAMDAVLRDPRRRARLIESVRFPLTGSERALSNTQKALIEKIVGGKLDQVFTPGAYKDNLRELRAAIMNATRYQIQQNSLNGAPLPITKDSFLYVKGADGE
jgi:hypothetical protein